MNSSSSNNNSGRSPEVSVIINCFNEARVVRETLDSVFAQTFEDWEIVFWDNASTDGSGEIAASYGDKVRCFRTDTLVSLGRARKLAYEESRGKYIAILDADDLWLPEKLEKQVALFRADPQVGMTYCDAVFFDDSGDRFRLYKLTTPFRGHAFGQLVAKNFIGSSAMMFRRDAVDHLGGAFDDRLTRAMDYELCLRIAYHYPIDYVDEPLIRWRINGVFGVPEKPWKKSLVSRAEDVKSAMENLLARFPEIEDRYPEELYEFYKEQEYGLGVSAWQNGDQREARSHFSRHPTGLKFALAYTCTYLMSCGSFYRVINNIRNTFSQRT